jgi:nucleoside-diphosphate-sugar epimerase
MTPIVITGASGFVGSHLTDAFRRFGRVIEIDQHRRSDTEDWIAWDLRERTLPSLPDRIQTLIHCAAATGSDPDGDGQACFDLNVRATAQLLSYARRAGAKQFVYFSTGSVYGMQKHACRETDARNPRGAYACSKAAAELLLCAYEPYLRTLCLRLFYPYGPGQQIPRLLPGILARLAAGQTIPLNGPEGYPKINPLFIADVVSWVERLIEGEASGTYNLAGTEILSIRDIATRMASLLATTAEYEYQRPVAGHLIGDITRVCKDTGISPAWTLDRGLAEVVRTYHHTAPQP